MTFLKKHWVAILLLVITAAVSYILWEKWKEMQITGDDPTKTPGASYVDVKSSTDLATENDMVMGDNPMA